LVGSAPQALADLTSVRQFLTGNGLFAFFDAPWLPIYLCAIFIMNVWMGFFALAGILILAGLAWTNEVITSKPLVEAGKVANFSSEQAGSHLRNAEVIQAMGMLPQLTARWFGLHQQYLSLQADASQRAAAVTALTKFFRMLFQSLILGIGALLVLQDQMTAGGMIAGSILLGRALSPLEQLIGVSKQFSSARQAYRRLEQLLEHGEAKSLQVDLPPPTGAIQVQDVSAVPPGGRTPVLSNINFELAKGEVLVVIGPSGSGKSSLARLLVGVWSTAMGKIRLDGADINQWDPAKLGKHLGYLPQDIEIFNGTVAENIARFSELDSEKIIAAAVAANVHELVLQMPNGYETLIGRGAYQMSGGQQQRMALARALYGEPTLVVLDEPNSNLDQAGEQALVQVLQGLKERGCTVIVITHRTNILQIATRVLVLAAGRAVAFGPPETVLNSGTVRAVPSGRTA
jgi:ATP-binding cassette subfamily C exporter for protease/lipase